MKPSQIYTRLANQMVKYADLINIPVKAVKEPLLPLTPCNDLAVNPIDPNMLPYTGQAIYVRQSVKDKLTVAADSLRRVNPNYKLEVVYGYRPLSIQRQLFKQYSAKLKDTYQGLALLEAVHRQIAVPSVAGHPTGGAVDVQITNNDLPLDLGTPIWQFDNDAFTYSPFVSAAGRTNRLLLRDVMMRAGFAPFNGEWWHFSYGDKEWAFYYQQPFALYEQIEFRIKL
jgi:D-alanyl-D-alanine dipeptidase